MTKKIDQTTLNYLLTQYDFPIENTEVTPLGNGLINDTFLVQNDKDIFVLQRINHHVFNKPEQVINNAEKINKHLLKKKTSKQYSLEPFWQIATVTGKASIHWNNQCWRAMQYVPNCYTLETLSTPKQAVEVATSFAQFTAALSDFPAETLEEIIPDFHHLNHRINQLEMAITQDDHQRLSSCIEQVNFCHQQHAFIAEVEVLTSKLPVQVTHNDTKINNLLFSNKTNKPLAVIDLDTCMPGYLMHDFGDLVRTCCSNLVEDDSKIEAMSLRLDIFDALAQGYITAFGNNISALEKHSLVVGAQLLPFMIGVRFLTDYLNGDVYFHTDYSAHNLIRARNQFALYDLLKQQRTELESIIANYCTERIAS